MPARTAGATLPAHVSPRCRTASAPTLPMIRRLHARLGIPLAALVRE